MIQAMRTFRISDELQERHGYPKLTKEIKAKILGLNGAALYGVEPNTETCVHAAGARGAASDAARDECRVGADDDGGDPGVPRRRP